MKEVLTVADACEYLQVSETTLLKLAHSGVLPGRKVGAQWRFLRSELERYLRGSSPSKAS